MKNTKICSSLILFILFQCFTLNSVLAGTDETKTGLQCHNCHGRHSESLDDCVPSPSGTLLDQLPKTSGVSLASDSRRPNVCLKMVTIMYGPSPDQNLMTVIRMGANMGELTPMQVAERLKSLNDKCTLESPVPPYVFPLNFVPAPQTFVMQLNPLPDLLQF